MSVIDKLEDLKAETLELAKEKLSKPGYVDSSYEKPNTFVVELSLGSEVYMKVWISKVKVGVTVSNADCEVVYSVTVEQLDDPEMYEEVKKLTDQYR